MAVSGTEAERLDLMALDRAADILPAARGVLARTNGADGHPRRVVFRISEQTGDAPVVGDATALARTLGTGTKRAHVRDLVSVELAGSGHNAGLAGQIAIVTGGASGLGYATAKALAADGAYVALLDIAEDSVRAAAERIGAASFACDVTQPEAVDAAVKRVVATFGGVDILISNAGAALQGALLDLDDALFQKSFALNFWGHHYVARAAVRVMRIQGTGGALVFNVSKQAVNPGPDFGAYGTPKAALLALVRQYAIEHGADGITSNAVNADRIRTGLMTERMVADRSRARGVTPDAYMRSNLVKREVTCHDVAQAFLFLAKARASTGAVLTVDGGNVAAMMR